VLAVTVIVAADVTRAATDGVPLADAKHIDVAIIALFRQEVPAATVTVGDHVPW